MNKKNIFLLSVFSMLTIANFVLAYETSTLNDLGFSGPSALPQFVAWLFGWLIGVAAVLAVISFAIGGIEIMAGQNSSGKDRLKGSVIGLLLCVSAFLILKTINPALTTPSLNSLPGSDGVFCNGKTSAPLEDSNTATSGCKSLTYVCNHGKLPPYFVWSFSGSGYQPISGASAKELSCSSGPVSVGGSYTMSYELPGVYYCMGSCTKNSCSSYMSGANVYSGQITAPFTGAVKSVVIVNDPSNHLYFGTIFHNTTDYSAGGNCSMPLGAKTDAQVCINGIPDGISSSVDIFHWNADSPQTSGNSIDFFSETEGWQYSQRAGFCYINQTNNNAHSSIPCKNLSTIGKFTKVSAKKLVFDYTLIDRDDKYQKLYQNFQQSPGSIRIDGQYLVALYADQSKNNDNSDNSGNNDGGTSGGNDNGNFGGYNGGSTSSGGDTSGPCGNGQPMGDCGSCYCPSSFINNLKKAVLAALPGIGTPINIGGGGGGGAPYCQTFTKNVPNGGTIDFTAKQNRVGDIYIIPTD